VKTNVFVETESHSYKSIGLQEDFYSDQILEDDLIDSIDSEKMSPERILTRRFLKFLGNRRLSIAKLRGLSVAEQARIKKEFLED
jgi:hypothetical protein